MGRVLLVSNRYRVRGIATHSMKHRITLNNKELSGPKVHSDQMLRFRNSVVDH